MDRYRHRCRYGLKREGADDSHPIAMDTKNGRPRHSVLHSVIVRRFHEILVLGISLEISYLTTPSGYTGVPQAFPTAAGGIAAAVTACIQASASKMIFSSSTQLLYYVVGGSRLSLWFSQPSNHLMDAIVELGIEARRRLREIFLEMVPTSQPCGVARRPSVGQRM